ncbi:hypothetical protein SUNI508_04915 [Seiridium unicorne]|uniref:Uncharacterized protein n=1 Tax=Seiridium unicorne TaxID=138068 RepID=A0ABR2V5V2_9PEZI
MGQLDQLPDPPIGSYEIDPRPVARAAVIFSRTTFWKHSVEPGTEIRGRQEFSDSYQEGLYTLTVRAKVKQNQKEAAKLNERIRKLEEQHKEDQSESGGKPSNASWDLEQKTHMLHDAQMKDLDRKTETQSTEPIKAYEFITGGDSRNIFRAPKLCDNHLCTDT